MFPIFLLWRTEILRKIGTCQTRRLPKWKFLVVIDRNQLNSHDEKLVNSKMYASWEVVDLCAL